jgi:two-component system CheB/CheR fusion protein
MPDDNDPKFEALLEYLSRTRGFDFTGYKRSSLARRVRKRMEVVNLTDFTDYMDYLEVHPEEFAQLFNTILINVTSFFRDIEAWNYLAAEIVPLILKANPNNGPVRVWSAGCASGQEAYSLAMVLAEALGEEAFLHRVKIYASDVDEEALAQARAASYKAHEMESVPEEYRKKYFIPQGDRFVFRADLRRAIIFGRHDLVQDAPISRLDLLVCRNTLMYLNAETQERILVRFHFALKDTGFLFLGRAEMLLTHDDLFPPGELKHRAFVKANRHTPRERLLLPPFHATDAEAQAANRLGRLRDQALACAPIGIVAVDAQGAVVLINDYARRLFNLAVRDVGRPLQDLEISYRPAELRSLIERARQQSSPVRVNGAERHLPNGELQYLDIEVIPLGPNGNGGLGASIVFMDTTHFHRLRGEVQRANQELETANEELQSAQEELETTNEELQSTNEELETMNEELQSTNEELETVNGELRQRSEELTHTNVFLRSILKSILTGVVVVDRQLRVRIWNERAEDLWGVRADETVGKSLLDLDIGLPIRQLEKPLQEVLSGTAKSQELVLQAHDRRGKAIQCALTCTPLVDSEKNSGAGVVVLMADAEAPSRPPGKQKPSGKG